MAVTPTVNDWKRWPIAVAFPRCYTQRGHGEIQRSFQVLHSPGEWIAIDRRCWLWRPEG